MRYYLLAGKEPVETNDIPAAMALLESPEGRRLALTQLPSDITVSTVFLVIAHGQVAGRPLLFETIIFGGVSEGYMLRSDNYDDALRNHTEAVKVAIDRFLQSTAAPEWQVVTEETPPAKRERQLKMEDAIKILELGSPGIMEKMYKKLLER